MQAVRGTSERAGGMSQEQGAFRRLLRGAAVTFILFALGSALGYIVHTVLARWLGPSEYGTFAYMLSWIDILAMATGLGLASSVLRYVPQYRATGETGLARAHAAFGGILTLISSVLCAGMLSFTDGVGVLRDGARGVWVAGVWAVPMLALLLYQMQLARSHGRVFVAYAPRMVLRHVAFLLALWVVMALAGGVSAETAMWVFTGSLLAVVILQQALMRNGAGDRAEIPAWRSWPVKEWMGVSLSLFGGSVLALLLQRIDLLMIGAYLSAEEVGFYNAASKTAGLTSFVVVAVNSVVAPQISAMNAKGERAGLEALVRRFSRYTLLATLAIAVGIGVLGRFVLSVFGADFLQSFVPLLILLSGYVVAAAVGLVLNLMNLTGHQNLVLRVYFVAVGVNVLTNFLLLPRFGMIGAAVATAFSMSVVNLMLFVLVRNRLGINPSAFGSATGKTV